MKKPYLDHIGRRFGRLVAVEYWVSRAAALCGCFDAIAARSRSVDVYCRTQARSHSFVWISEARSCWEPRSCGFANADLQIMGGDEAALHQIAALNSLNARGVATARGCRRG
jgi:hypothetical protein